MLRLAEKTRRKAAELLYQAGLLKASAGHRDEPLQSIHHVKTQFVFRFYPYHFIHPDQIKPDFVFDGAGVPQRYRLDSRDYTNSLYPAYWGLIHLNQYERGIAREACLQTILQMSDYLILHSRMEGEKMFFDYTVNHEKVFLKAPWVSGLTQGLAASLLLRTYLITSDSRYRDAALQCARVLVTPLEQGGVLDYISDKHPWIEEYPGSPPTHVLNGCLFGLIALIECAHQADSTLWQDADLVAHSVLRVYPQFRAGHYLRYDLRRIHFCNPHYMGLHVLLFFHLSQSTANNAFLQIARDLSTRTAWPLYMRSVHRSFSDVDEQWIHQQLYNT